MKLRTVLPLLAVLTCAPSANASGYRSPAHSQLSYSFTCQSGSSGHIIYTRDTLGGQASSLRMWVNGSYIDEAPEVSKALLGRNIEQIQASCTTDQTLVIVSVFDSNGEVGKQLSNTIITLLPSGEIDVQPNVVFPQSESDGAD